MRALVCLASVALMFITGCQTFTTTPPDGDDTAGQTVPSPLEAGEYRGDLAGETTTSALGFDANDDVSVPALVSVNEDGLPTSSVGQAFRVGQTIFRDFGVGDEVEGAITAIRNDGEELVVEYDARLTLRFPLEPAVLAGETAVPMDGDGVIRYRTTENALSVVETLDVNGQSFEGIDVQFQASRSGQLVR